MGRKKIQISRIVDQRNRQVGDVSFRVVYTITTYIYIFIISVLKLHY